MEQARRTRPHLERVMFVVGAQNAGKSMALRRMFQDPRLGTQGQIPDVPRIKLTALSLDRCLFVRCTSPHETHQTLPKFCQKLDARMKSALRKYWRFNFACAMQPDASNKMPDLITVCREFLYRFEPERLRVIQIDPRQNGQAGNLLTPREVDRLRNWDVEVMTIDARKPRNDDWHPNGALLADYFDFT